GRIPQAGVKISTCHEQAPPVRTEGKLVHQSIVTHWWSDRRAGRSVPDASSRIPTAGGNAVTVGAESQAADGTFVAQQRCHGFARADVIDLCDTLNAGHTHTPWYRPGLAKRSGHHPASIGAQTRQCASVRRPDDLSDRAPCICLPDAHRSVRSERHDPPSVVTEFTENQGRSV